MWEGLHDVLPRVVLSPRMSPPREFATTSRLGECNASAQLCLSVSFSQPFTVHMENVNFTNESCSVWLVFVGDVHAVSRWANAACRSGFCFSLLFFVDDDRQSVMTIRNEVEMANRRSVIVVVPARRHTVVVRKKVTVKVHFRLVMSRDSVPEWKRLRRLERAQPSGSRQLNCTLESAVVM